MKKRFYSEVAYLLGLVFLALGTALMEHANFGMSMVVASAYIVYLKVATFLPWFTFGMAEYCLQLVLLLILALVIRSFKVGYLFSFVTAVLYGVVLDGIMSYTTKLPMSVTVRIVTFILGMIFCCFGVAFFFKTYLAPEAYELIVKEIANLKGFNIGHVKTFYDMTSLLIAVILSFSFFGWLVFKGVYWGTLITALTNGQIINYLSNRFDQLFEVEDAFPLKKYFN